MVEVQQSYREFLGRIDKIVSELPYYVQDIIKPELFQAWEKARWENGIGDTTRHITSFSFYTAETEDLDHMFDKIVTMAIAGRD